MKNQNQTTRSEKILITMDEIEDYTGRNRKLIKRWIAKDNFPAVKVDGRWQSSTALIDSWNDRYIMGLTVEGLEV